MASMLLSLLNCRTKGDVNLLALEAQSLSLYIKMAEVAGLTGRTVYLAGLFMACVESPISIRKIYGKGYEASRIKPLLLKARPNAWEESLLTTHQDNQKYGRKSRTTVGKYIKTIFEDGRQN